MNRIFTLEELPEVAKSIIESAGTKVILFYGEMGVGKTTLIKQIAKDLGVEGTLTSPTFSIVNEHLLPTGKLYHFDFYRLETEIEALDLGFEDYLESGEWILIEWPERIPSLIPEKQTTIRLHKNPNGTRTLTMNAYAIV